MWYKSSEGWFHHLISQKSFSVDVQRSVDGIRIESLAIVSAVTAIDLDEETIILEIHECFSVKNNYTSHLSTFRARETGVIVNDVAKRYRCKHNIECVGYKFPFIVDDGLMNIQMQEPIMDERLNCTRIILT